MEKKMHHDDMTEHQVNWKIIKGRTEAIINDIVSTLKAYRVKKIMVAKAKATQLETWAKSMSGSLKGLRSDENN